jgi:hypothetical protein
MVAGHFGFAAIVKSRERQAPLWVLMLACQWLDVIFVPLFVAGIETITPVDLPSSTSSYGNVIIYADYTHSLVGALALSLVFGWIAALIWGKRTGLILGGVVFSHWLLDLLMHRSDMPILPGNAGHLPRLGFGLWRHPVASVAAELVLVLAGAWMYWRAAVEVTESDGRRSRTLAHVAGGLMLFAGLVTLTLNVLGY